MLDSTETPPATDTEVGSYFVANYPPFSAWTPEAVGTDALSALGHVGLGALENQSALRKPTFDAAVSSDA